MPVIVTGPLGPTDPILDVYPTHESRFEKGGARDAETIADRDLIPLERRDWTMMVTVWDDPTPTNNTVWMLCPISLGGNNDDITNLANNNLNWVDIGQGAGVISVTDDGNGVVTVDNTDPDNPIVGFAGVNTDNLTITGDGTALDPLVATAVGSGTDLEDFALAVKVATLAVLPGSPTYSNGVAGVGATLTRGSNGTLGTIDTISGFTIGDRILVKDQAVDLQNGIYEVTQVGATGGGGSPYILTRTTDSDEDTEFDDQVVAPSSGAQAGSTFGQQTSLPVIGTDPIVYSLGSVFVRQKTSGTQVLGQIPWWLTTKRTLSKGNADLTWDDVNKIFTVASGGNTTFIVDPFNTQYALGDLFNVGSGTFLNIVDAAEITILGTTGGSNQMLFEIDAANQMTSIRGLPLAGFFTRHIVDFTPNYTELRAYNDTVNFNSHELRFGSFSGTPGGVNQAEYIGFISPEDGSTVTITYILPAAVPTAGQVLSSTAPSAGVATLSWSTVSGLAGSWLLDGNTVGSLKWLGTIDNFDLPFRTNNVEKFRILTDGTFTTTVAENLFIDSTGFSFLSDDNFFWNAIASGGSNKTANVCFLGEMGAAGGTQQGSFLFGLGAQNIGNDSISMGALSFVSGNKTLALGYASYAGTDNTIALGNAAEAKTVGQTTIGTTISTTGGSDSTYAVFLGNNYSIVNDYADCLVFGSGGVDFVFQGASTNRNMLIGIAPGLIDASSSHTFVLKSGTAPTTVPADSAIYYTSDIVAGNAAPHFRTEAGNIIKLYTHAAVGSVQGIADALTTLGLLTTSSIAGRIVAMADATSFTPTSATADINTQTNTQAAGTLTANAPSGSPVDGQQLQLRIKCTNVQTMAWNAIYRGSNDITLPTATTGTSKIDYFLLQYHATDTKWDLLAKSQGY